MLSEIRLESISNAKIVQSSIILHSGKYQLSTMMNGPTLCVLFLTSFLSTVVMTTETTCPSHCFSTSSTCINNCYNTLSNIINNIGKRAVMEANTRQRRYSCYDMCQAMYTACCGSNWTKLAQQYTTMEHTSYLFTTGNSHI